MIDIHTDMQISYCDVDMPFSVLEAIMNDDIVKDDDFIVLNFSIGTKGALMKKHITGFTEVEQEAETY